MNKCSKFTIYMINIQKPVVFLYIINEQSENDIKKQLHLKEHQNNTMQ